MGFSSSWQLDPAQPHCADTMAARNENKLILCTVLEKVRSTLRDKSIEKLTGILQGYILKNAQILLVNKIAPSAPYTGIENSIASDPTSSQS